MLNTKRILTAAVALLAAQMAWGKDVIESMPDDAIVGMKVANLARTSGKFAKLCKDFGVDQFEPSLKDPLGALKTQLKVSKGLREDGEMGLVVLMPQKENAEVPPVRAPNDMAAAEEAEEAMPMHHNPNEPGVIILVPVTSFDEFVANFDGAKTEGGVATVRIAGERKPTYIGNWGEYAALSPTQKLVAAKPTKTLKLNGVAAKESARQDALVYANFAKITPEVMPDLDKALEKAIAELDRQKELPEKWRPLIKTSVTQMFGAARAFLRDADSAVMGVNISDAGVNTSVLAEFKPDSYLGKFTASLKGTDQPLTIGLPATKYLAWGGSAIDPTPVASAVDDFTKPIVEELNKIEGQENARQVASDMLAAIKANRGTAFGMPTPTKLGEDAIFQQVAIYNGGGAETRKVMNSAGSLINQILADVKMPEGQAKPVFTITPNARTIEGVAFDTWKFEPPAEPDNPAAAQVEMMMGLMYGKQGMSYSFAQLPGGNDFILGSSASDATIAMFIKSHQAREDNLSKLEHVKVVANELPKVRIYEAYIALDEMVTTGVGVAGQMGMPVPLQLPPDLPPVGMTMGTEGSAMRMDAHIPTTTVSALIAAGMQVFMNMQNAGQGNL